MIREAAPADCEPSIKPPPQPRPKSKPALSNLLHGLSRRKLDAGDLLIVLILFLILTEQEADTLTIGLTLAFFLFL